MGRTRKYNRRNNNKNKRRRHRKTYRGGELGQRQGELGQGQGQGQAQEEKKTFFSVIGEKAKDAFIKGTNLALGVAGLQIKKPESPPQQPVVEEKKEPNEAVQAMSNVAENITDAANDVVEQTLKFTEQLNNPATVKRLEESLDNVAKIAGPLTDKIADKVSDVFEKESPKIAAAGTDMLVSAANAIPGVGAVISLGREANDLQKIAESALQATQEVVKTVSDATIEGAETFKEIKNNTNLQPPPINVPNINIPSINTAATNATNANANTNAISSQTAGGRNLRMLQKAGATINRRTNNSINEFLGSKKTQKTQKKKKKVRFSV
jgi:hypothetical protein